MLKLAARGLAQSFDMASLRVRAESRLVKLMARNSVGGPRGWREAALTAAAPAAPLVEVLVLTSVEKARLRGAWLSESGRGLTDGSRDSTVNLALTSLARAAPTPALMSSSLVSGVSASSHRDVPASSLFSEALSSTTIEGVLRPLDSFEEAFDSDVGVDLQDVALSAAVWLACRSRLFC